MLWCSPEMYSGEPKGPTRTALPRYIGQDMPSKGPSSPLERSGQRVSTDSTFGAEKPVETIPRGSQ
jgi:hypothetical protein